MRHTRIDIKGENDIFATITQRYIGDCIDIDIISPQGDTKLRVSASDRDDQWSMAERLQRTLDGFTGSGGDVREYFQAIEHFAS